MMSSDQHRDWGDGEDKDRIKDLMSGPWSGESAKARRVLKRKLPLRQKGELISKFNSMDELYGVVSHADRHRDNTYIKKLLRPHWKSSGIPPKDFPTRDSFDEALTALQLLELAIVTGYLSENVALEAARRELIALLWSKGARTFVFSYDYYLVEGLASRARLQLRPQRSAALPLIASSPDRFAMFLSFHSGWYDNPQL